MHRTFRRFSCWLAAVNLAADDRPVRATLPSLRSLNAASPFESIRWVFVVVHISYILVGIYIYWTSIVSYNFGEIKLPLNNVWYVFMRVVLTLFYFNWRYAQGVHSVLSCQRDLSPSKRNSSREKCMFVRCGKSTNCVYWVKVTILQCRNTVKIRNAKLTWVKLQKYWYQNQNMRKYQK